MIVLELCFDASARGALRCAAGPVIGTQVFAVLTAGGSRREQREALRRARAEAVERRRNAVPLGGTAADVLGLPLGLSQGDIRSPLAQECPRGELLRRMITAAARYVPEFPPEAAEREAAEHWTACLEDLRQLERRAAEEPVRIWADSTPDSQCGLLFAAELLARLGARASLVRLPPWRARQDGVVECCAGWGEVSAEELGGYLPLEEPLPPPVLGMLAERWRELQRENAPLRAVVNGRVRSVEADFYDPAIRREFPEGEIRVAALIGKVLSRQPGVGDGLIAHRIQALLEAGELRMVREEAAFYTSVVARGGGRR